MNLLARLTLVALLLLAVGGAALFLQSWVTAADARPDRPATPDSGEGRYESARRQRIALAVLAVTAIAAVTVAAALPASRSRQGDGGDTARRSVEWLARAAAGQGEALARERDVRQRTEENLALEQLRAGQAMADKARLGRDLHDGIAQTLYATGLVLETARGKIHTQPERATVLLDQGVTSLNLAIRDVRTCIDGLAAASRQGGSFPAAVQAITAMLGSGRPAVFDVRLDTDAVARIGETQLADLLHIVRETVSNALRHGEARNVAIRLSADETRLALSVHDDGHGFDPAKVSRPGHGLANLRTRAALLHGELSLTSTPGTGTRVVLTVPVPRPLP